PRRDTERPGLRARLAPRRRLGCLLARTVDRRRRRPRCPCRRALPRPADRPRRRFDRRARRHARDEPRPDPRRASLPFAANAAGRSVRRPTRRLVGRAVDTIETERLRLERWSKRYLEDYVRVL